jgi:hypothetical protein
MSTPILENNFKSYRISEGKVKIGRVADGNLEELAAISGHLLRVGYTEGESETGDKYAYVECDLENAEGEQIRVKSSVGLNQTASQVAPCGFAMGLLACKLNDDIGIFPTLSKTADPKYGKFSTYVNIGIVNPATGKYVQVKPDRNQFPGETSKQKWPHVLEALREHECYAERPSKDDESGEASDLSIFSKIDTDKRWPSPFGKAKGTYLQGLADMAGIAGVYEDYAEVPQNVINDFATAYEGSTFDDVPENLQPFLEDKPKAFGKKAS